MTIFAPCKLNLILRILGRRPDGFHALETLMVPITVGDTLELTRQDVGIGLTCSRPDLPVDRHNLVYRAAELFFHHFKVTGGVRIHLEKKVPVGAGLGGGSSDAAQTLRGLNDLFGVGAREVDLMSLSEQLGSDVAFFIPNQPAWCRGRGEIVEPLAWTERLGGVLVHPGFGVSTPWAYQAYAKNPQLGVRGQAFRAGALQNDLEPAVFAKYLWLPTVKRWFQQQPEVWDALMSGSGSSVFALTESPAAAAGLQDQFRAHFGAELFTETFQLFCKN